MTDPIADMLTRIRNAQASKKEEVLIPRSNFKAKLAEILQGEKYISESREVEEGGRPFLKILLNYEGGRPAIERLERISKPGQRIYSSHDNIPKALGGDGVVVISTPKGLMTDKEARKQKVGGEVICQVW